MGRHAVQWQHTPPRVSPKKLHQIIDYLVLDLMTDAVICDALRSGKLGTIHRLYNLPTIGHHLFWKGRFDDGSLLVAPGIAVRKRIVSVEKPHVHVLRDAPMHFRRIRLPRETLDVGNTNGEREDVPVVCRDGKRRQRIHTARRHRLYPFGMEEGKAITELRRCGVAVHKDLFFNRISLRTQQRSGVLDHGDELQVESFDAPCWISSVSLSNECV